jgi:hypothetical protein
MWSQQQEFRDVVYPIVIQTLQQRGTVVEPLGQIAGESLKELQEDSSTGLAWVVASQIKADSSKFVTFPFISRLTLPS